MRQHYGAAVLDFAALHPGYNWRFLPTTSEKELTPIIDAYGQTIIRDLDEKGEPRPSLSHILRVFLIDPNDNDNDSRAKGCRPD